jgi:diguanylate cyclase (GGDEF)-like protein
MCCFAVNSARIQNHATYYYCLDYRKIPKRVVPMPKLEELLTGSNSAVRLIILAATGAALLTIAAGLLVYGDMQSVISADQWVIHTEDVLASLQNAYLLVERVEYRMPLYQLSRDEIELNRARTAANQFDTATIRIKFMVSDNANQSSNVESLTSCSTELSRALSNVTLVSTLPEPEIQRCQRTIGRMLDQEQMLLKDRTARSQQSSLASIWTGVGFALLSLLTLLTLFGILLRHALRRERIDKQAQLTNWSLSQSVQALEDRAGESELLTSARDELQLCVDVKQAYQSATNGLSRLLAGTSGSLCLINNSRQLVEVVSTWPGTGAGRGDESALEDVFSPESCCGLRSGHPRWRVPQISEIHCTHFAGNPPQRYLCLPIIAHGNTMGVLYVQCHDVATVELVNRHMDGLRQLVQFTGMAVATLNLRTKLENQSIRDSLTGLFNRHFMQISLERELARIARRKQSLAVFMLDVDQFKKFNDTHGHAAGDMVLKAIADIFLSSIRSEDIAYRYGGEEFTIILPDIIAAAAWERAESVRLAVMNLRVPLEQEVNGDFTVSIGVALYPNDGEAADLLLRRADQALYRAKRLGRNQVAIHEAGASVA